MQTSPDRIQREPVLKRTARLRLSLARSSAEELLDLGAGTAQDVRANLAEMWRINRWLGGQRALAQHLYARLQPLEQARVVDLGAGSGHTARELMRWAQRRQRGVSVIALDIAARHLAVARENLASTPDIALLQADAARLPLPPASADYVISSLLLHHFAPDDAVALLRAAYRCARRGIIMTDLVRGWAPLAAFKLIQPVFARNFLTRHDGALSVRRAYTPDELQSLAQAAGLRGAQVIRHWPWRMTLVVDK